MSTSKPAYFSFFTFGLTRYIDNLLLRVRSEVVTLFNKAVLKTLKASGEKINSPMCSVLDIGVSDDDHISSNLLEKKLGTQFKITGVGLENYKHLENIYSQFNFVQANGLQLPFADQSFDFVYSHAVIEHVGHQKQDLFLSEALRVSKKLVFLTTPNRWHPVEPHTGLPMIHFLPNKIYQKIFGLLGKNNFDHVDKLELLSKSDLEKLVFNYNQLNNCNLKHQIFSIKWLGFTSNLVLVIYK